MRRRLLFALTVAALLAGPSAAAQVVVPRGGEVTMNSAGRTARTERTPGTGRTPGKPGTPGTDRIASTQGRTPGTPGTPGTGRTPGTPRSLPQTGTSAESVAFDAVTLLGAGALLLRFRRRLLV